MERWDLSLLLQGKSIDDNLQEIETMLSDFESCKEELPLSAATFKRRAEQYAAIIDSLSRVGHYAARKVDEDASDPAASSIKSRLDQFSSKASNRMRFFSHWFKHLEDASEYLAVLGDDRYYFEHLRSLKDFTLPEKEENIISIKDSTGSSVQVRLWDMMDGRLTFTLGGEEFTAAQLTAKFTGPDAQERRAAYQEYYKVRGQDRDLVFEIYKAIALNWENERELRGYPSAISMRNKNNDLPDDVVAAMLDACRASATLWQRYFALKGTIMGRTLTRYDLYAPLTQDERTYSYEEAVALTMEALRSFSPKFEEAAKEIYAGPYVDVFPRKNKDQGAFCAGISPSLPPYLLYNYTDTLRDVRTVAHETGHGVHHQLSRACSVLACDHAIPIAETASTFSELLLADRMREGADATTRKSLLIQQLDNMYATIGRQAFFVLFEIEAHKRFVAGETLEQMSDAYLANLHELLGEIEIAPEFRYEWLAIPHFVHFPFYCYGYSFGNLLALGIYALWKEQGEALVEKYHSFLAAGETAAPADLCSKHLGITLDAAFWQKGLSQIEAMIDELEGLD